MPVPRWAPAAFALALATACEVDDEARGDCREARHACAAGFQCIACPDGRWRCAPSSDPASRSVCGTPDGAPATQPSGDGMPPATRPARDEGRSFTAVQDGRPLCPDGFTHGPEITEGPVGLHVSARCEFDGVIVRFEPDLAPDRPVACVGLDTSRPCPQTVLDPSAGDGGPREIPLGTVEGEARLTAGRLVGACTCTLEPRGGLPGRRVEARFDLPYPAGDPTEAAPP